MSTSAKPRTPPADITRTQALASDPDRSAFVAANAGAGKTYVLVNRVIRLLLRNVPPERILCITFTKAAAANMAQRVYERLATWITLDDDALDRAIIAAGGETPDAEIRERARRLFACALETPGGLKVQTIHALCTRLLQQFPFEANVPARFAVLDDRDRAEIMDRASLGVLIGAAADPDSAAGRALAVAMTSSADLTFNEVVREACLSNEALLPSPAGPDDIEAAVARLSRTLGLNDDDSIEAIEQAIVDGPHLPVSDWAETAAIFARGSTNDQNQANRLIAALEATGPKRIASYCDVFLTGGGELRKNILTKTLAKDEPALAALLDREAARLTDLLDRRKAITIRERTRALLVIACAVADSYRREKQERGLLDYDDLIDKTLAMLTRDEASSSWVHYKLDRGVDHLLIDEAQDTSPKQWAIVNQIASDFASGEGARDGVTRTIFAVGDEKQSIFSFQGAAPHAFDEQRRFHHQRFTNARLTFDSIKFTYSFRSGPSILQAVQSAFEPAEIFRSVTTDTDGMPPHMALADAAPDLVDLWELQAHEDSARGDIEAWRVPFDKIVESDPVAKLAERIATTIKDLIAHDGKGRDGERTPLTAGDILILVRRRNALFDTVIEALKRADIPVAGADRLKLTEHIAIIDLMNLADALLLSHDDLALAVALKSPLFDLSEDQLYSLAHDRKGTLRAQLRRQSRDDPQLRAADELLRLCEAKAGGSPFAFFSWLLGDSGRRRILHRLSYEANDALDEFLELALSYEQRAPATLQGFLAWLRSAEIEIKRDMDVSRHEVRVMTVHGAKGLEAPVVFLIDTTSSPTDSSRLSLIRVPAADGGGNCIVWASAKGDDPPAVAAARDAMLEATEDEYRRLLYVAMTRAAERLIVCGVIPGNRKEVRPGSWYDLILKGLDRSGLDKATIETGYGPVQRYCRTPFVSGGAPAAVPQAKATAPIELPSWLREKVGPPPTPPKILRPSDLVDDEIYFAQAGEDSVLRRDALQRGTLVHRLLQSLPDIDASRRHDAALLYLARNAAEMPQAARDQLVAQTLALIEAPQFAALFAPGSRAEVPVVGRITRKGQLPQPVSGQIDRLVVTASEVMIADYKTNHAPPRNVADVPPAYRRQLALYRGVLAKLYPAHNIRAALVWTETLEMMELSAETLDAELARIING